MLYVLLGSAVSLASYSLALTVADQIDLWAPSAQTMRKNVASL